MISTSSSITGLRKCAKNLAAKLESLGFEAEHDSFSCGPGGGQYYGQSYVTVEAERGNDEWIRLKVYADSYGEERTWREIKRELLSRIEAGEKRIVM